MYKKILFIITCLFFGTISVSAKEIDFYFYPNGGTPTTPGFEVGSYGYINNNYNFYASYTDKDTIKNINSIAGQKFTLSKANTSLVKGREWYFGRCLSSPGTHRERHSAHRNCLTLCGWRNASLSPLHSV